MFLTQKGVQTRSQRGIKDGVNIPSTPEHQLGARTKSETSKMTKQSSSSARRRQLELEAAEAKAAIDIQKAEIELQKAEIKRQIIEKKLAANLAV